MVLRKQKNEVVFTALISALKDGVSVIFNPSGKSMEPRIMDGQEVKVVPIDPAVGLKVDDVVFCKVAGHIYLHKVLAIGTDGRVLIGNNKSKVNGWSDEVYGKVEEIK